MTSPLPCALANNGGSSSIRFAVYEVRETPLRRLDGTIDRIGLRGTNLIVHDPAGTPLVARHLAAADHRTAVAFLLEWLERQPIFASVEAAGHCVVHGMVHSQPERVTPKLLAGLRRITAYAPEHLPREIALIEAFRRRHPTLPQVACFDTAFHRTLPRVAAGRRVEVSST
jgi:acetate kinase